MNAQQAIEGYIINRAAHVEAEDNDSEHDDRLVWASRADDSRRWAIECGATIIDIAAAEEADHLADRPDAAIRTVATQYAAHRRLAAMARADGRPVEAQRWDDAADFDYAVAEALGATADDLAAARNDGDREADVDDSTPRLPCGCKPYDCSGDDDEFGSVIEADPVDMRA